MREPCLLDTILAPGALEVVFQPIFEIRDGARRPHSFEGLVRGPKGSNIESPNILFEYVRRKREEPSVDRACVLAVLEAVGQLPSACAFSVNVHASTLGRDREFVAFLADAAATRTVALSRLTVEIVEHAPFWDGPCFMDALSGLRVLGARIALDDVGIGYSNHRMILDCLPDFLKVDRYLVQGAHADPLRRAILESMANLSRVFGARVIAEGVETALDLEAATGAGIELVQGFLLAPPLSAAQLSVPDAVPA